MALTQQLARVTPRYLEQCRQNAAASPDNDPQWDPPQDDTLDLDWAIWGLISFFRWAHVDTKHLDALDRSISGDNSSDVACLDHPEVYDGFDAPPALLAHTEVAQVADILNAIDLDQALSLLPSNSTEAAQACGFEGFNGHPRDYLVQHFTALRSFYNTAAQRGLAVVTWVD
ncbi:DUF1877 family protein [Streptomyces sp. NPDC046977]|uniref:DUF1877 family protein n=1 Tax=Streptomyces sp. NPDC046977 TaxID=3154703 RepID=UPI0033D743A5